MRPSVTTLTFGIAKQNNKPNLRAPQKQHVVSSQPTTMNRLKSAFSSGASKVTGAFEREGSTLQQLGNAEHEEQPILNEPTITRAQIVIHGAVMFLTFIAICTMGAVAGFQSKWLKTVSGGTGFTLFLLLLSFILSCILLTIPIVYDRWDRLKRSAQFLSQPRSKLILGIFGAILMLIAAFIVTISAWGAKGCKNPDNDPHEKLGDDFKHGLKGWCTTKKASAIFDWFALGGWGALVALAGIEFRNDRQVTRHREPSFVPPQSPTGEEGTQRYDPVRNNRGEDDDVFADKHEAYPLGPSGGASYRNFQADSAMARPSVDAYGAFDGDMPGAAPQRSSRTMQMAFQDPYADVRASVLADQGYAGGNSAPLYGVPEAGQLYGGSNDPYALPQSQSHSQPRPQPPRY
ncbi:hypothetical protein Q8F55_007724 [Vanrija albida]|uniref:MARVEL domain-containing protein n=1 Tax=Vanrija albida TaxID=181172 RepID=A0ABR3PUD0_9TREE